MPMSFEMSRPLQGEVFDLGIAQPENQIDTPVLWEVNRHHAVALAGGRAMWMQLAHPAVAQAVADHGIFQDHPAKRLMQTGKAGIWSVFGTTEEAKLIIGEINGRHGNVKGVINEAATRKHPAGEPYDAQDPAVKLWVAATVVDSAIVGYEKFVKPLSDGEKDQYWDEAKLKVFALFGLPPKSLPKTYKDLQAYIEKMINDEEVDVSPFARKLSEKAVLSHSPITGIPASFLKLTTIYTIDSRLRKKFGHKDIMLQRALFNNFASAIRENMDRLPAVFREFTSYKRAMKGENVVPLSMIPFPPPYRE